MADNVEPESQHEHALVKYSPPEMEDFIVECNGCDYLGYQTHEDLMAEILAGRDERNAALQEDYRTRGQTYTKPGS